MSIVTQLRNRWFALKGAKRPIPAGFMKLDYLESTGTQWIDIGVKFSQINSSYVIRQRELFTSFEPSKRTYQAELSGRESASYRITGNGEIFPMGYAGTYVVLNTMQWYDIEFRLSLGSTIHKKSNALFVDGVDAGSAHSDTSAATALENFLFGMQYTEAQPWVFCKMRKSSCIMTIDDVAVRDYTPLLALPGTTYVDGNTGNSVTAADFKPGMYDYVSNRFFVNQATTGEDFSYIPDNEVWYAADSKQTLYTSSGVVSHEFADGRGVLKFASAVTVARIWLPGTSVTAVVLPKTVSSLYSYFMSKTGTLRKINIPDSVTSIPTSAFGGCVNLELGSLHEGIVSIGQAAFINCAKLEISSIPASVEIIDDYAFERCWGNSGVTALTFEGTPDSISNACFSRTQSSSIALTDIYVPWAEGEVEGAPWGANNATIHYNSTTTA